MTTPYDFLLDHADAEFDSKALNGASLMGTLSKLDAKAAADTATYEGYSAWSVALHVAYSKWAFANQMLEQAGEAPLGPYPFPKGTGGYSEPTTVDGQAWDAFKEYLVRLHRDTMQVIRSAQPALLAGAQIRNMGLPVLRGQRLG